MECSTDNSQRPRLDGRLEKPDYRHSCVPATCLVGMAAPIVHSTVDLRIESLQSQLSHGCALSAIKWARAHLWHSMHRMVVSIQDRAAPSSFSSSAFFKSRVTTL